MIEKIVNYLLNDDNFRLIKKGFDGMTILEKMYSDTSTFFQPRETLFPNSKPKVISKEGKVLYEYLKSGVMPEDSELHNLIYSSSSS